MEGSVPISLPLQLCHAVIPRILLVSELLLIPGPDQMDNAGFSISGATQAETCLCREACIEKSQASRSIPVYKARTEVRFFVLEVVSGEDSVN